MLSRWYRKIAESGDDSVYTNIDSQNRKPNLLNNIILLPSLIIFAFAVVRISLMWIGPLFGTGSKVREGAFGLPILPHADMGHGLENVDQLGGSSMPELSFFVGIAALCLVGSEFAFWWQMRFIPYSVVEKMIPYWIRIYPMLAFGSSITAVMRWMWHERSPERLTGCDLVTVIDEKGKDMRVAKCTVQFIACNALSWYGVPDSISAPVCLGAKAANWCALGCLFCSSIILSIHGHRYIRRRRWLKQHGMKGGVSINIFNPDESVTVSWIPPWIKLLFLTVYVGNDIFRGKYLLALNNFVFKIIVIFWGFHTEEKIKERSVETVEGAEMSKKRGLVQDEVAGKLG